MYIIKGHTISTLLASPWGYNQNDFYLQISNCPLALHPKPTVRAIRQGDLLAEINDITQTFLYTYDVKD